MAEKWIVTDISLVSETPKRKEYCDWSVVAMQGLVQTDCMSRDSLKRRNGLTKRERERESVPVPWSMWNRKQVNLSTK